MKYRIYILLSFLIGILCHAVASESFEKQDDRFDELQQIRNRRQSGVRPGEVEDLLFRKYDQKKVAYAGLRKYSRDIINGQQDLLELWGSAEEGIEKAIKIKRQPKQSFWKKLWTRFRACVGYSE